MTRHRTIAARLFALAALGASLAHAQAPGMPPYMDKAECVASFDRAQRAQSQRRLRAARVDLVACASDACPTAVREDCARSLIALDASLPTVVFSMISASGEDATDVRVTVDGELAKASLDGRAYALDPGPHTVVFEHGGGGAVEMKVVLREGEKTRVLQASLKKDPPPAPPPVAAAPLPPPVVRIETRERRSPVPIVPVGLGVLGAGAMGTSLYLRLRMDADADAMRGSCAPACDQGQRDALSSKLVAANVSLGIGLALLAGAAVTWILTPSSTHTSTRNASR